MKEKILYCYLVTYVSSAGGVANFENVEIAKDKPIGLGFAHEFIKEAESLNCTALVNVVSIGNYTESEWENHKVELEVKAVQKIKQLADEIELYSEGFEK